VDSNLKKKIIQVLISEKSIELTVVKIYNITTCIEVIIIHAIYIYPTTITCLEVLGNGGGSDLPCRDSNIIRQGS
jgi:hypothetical protein